MKKYIFLWLFSIQFFLLADQKPLVVGTTSGYAPFVSLDQKGNYEGFDIDFAEALAKKLDQKLVIKDCGSMPGLILALEQGKIDLIIWAVSITEERSKKMEMVYYQGEKIDQMPFLFWNEIPSNINTIEDLGKNSKGFVSVEAGSWQESVLKNYSMVNSKQVDKITDAVMEIRYGKSASAMADPSLIHEITSQYTQIKVKYLPIKQSEYCLGNGIAIKKSNAQLALRVKVATEALIAEKKVAELEKKWGISQ
jgi:ABC-type amino acid transport substrate-binding protein